MRRKRFRINRKILFPLLVIILLFFKKIFAFIKILLSVLISFFSNSQVQKIIFLFIGCTSLIILAVIVISQIVKEKKEQKRQAEIQKQKEEAEKLAKIEAIREELKKAEEARLAAIEAKKRKKIAAEKERIRLEKEYQYGYRDDMDGYEYEKYCADLFRYFHWEANVTRKSGDFGGDVIAKRKGITVVAQCKKYSNQKVSYKAVQEACAAKEFYKANYAIVITNSHFTESAKTGARKIGVYLLRHPDLCKWLSKIMPHNPNIIELKDIDKEMTLEKWTKYHKNKLNYFIDVFKMIGITDENAYKVTYNFWKISGVDSNVWVDWYINKLNEIFYFLNDQFGVNELDEAVKKLETFFSINNDEYFENMISLQKRMTLEKWKKYQRDKLQSYVDIFKLIGTNEEELYDITYNNWKNTNIDSNIWIDWFITNVNEIFFFLGNEDFSVEEVKEAIKQLNKLISFKSKKQETNEIMTLEIWTERYKDKLKPFVAMMKTIEGDSFDLFKESYIAWKETDIESDEWVDYLIKSMQMSFNELAEELGVSIHELEDVIKNNYDSLKEKLNLQD